jgi:hypothetical protein
METRRAFLRMAGVSVVVGRAAAPHRRHDRRAEAQQLVVLRQALGREGVPDAFERGEEG